MNILLTGGAGYIGSHVALSLLDNGHKVTIIDSLVTGTKKLVPAKSDYFRCDISDIEKINEILKKNKFDLVMHFAGLTKVDESVLNPDKYHVNNFEKSKIFFNLCFKNNIKKVIFSSTAGVYGNSGSTYKKETDELNPINPYAKSKYEIEKFLIENSKIQNLQLFIWNFWSET